MSEDKLKAYSNEYLYYPYVEPTDDEIIFLSTLPKQSGYFAELCKAAQEKQFSNGPEVKNLYDRPDMVLGGDLRCKTPHTRTLRQYLEDMLPGFIYHGKLQKD